MNQKKQIRTLLVDEDDDLFKRVMSKYDLKEGDLLREIVHAWLFTIKLNLMGENGNPKRKRKKTS